MIDVNLNGVFYGLRHQIPAILRSGGGAIVNVSSILQVVGDAANPAYVAAKHAVTGLGPGRQRWPMPPRESGSIPRSPAIRN